MRILCLMGLLLCSMSLSAQLGLRFEEGYALDHPSCIAAYESLAKQYPGKCRLEEAGSSDSGRPIHLFTSGDMAEHKPTLLINNGIHAGESCGVDASVLLMEELLRSDSPILDRVNIAVIPMYNVGGALNRSCCTRANQVGPIEQGFRGNAQNLDLNRDFIKADSRNALTFFSVFQRLKPELFVDTHTSNGADYPYTMTLITNQLDMIDPHLANSYRNSLIPSMYKAMESSYPMIPYVDLVGRTPEEGLVEFPDYPRYTTGYAALFNCLGFTTEAHMLKPYRDRVLATYHFLKALAEYASIHDLEIKMNKQKADRDTKKRTEFGLDYELDTLQVDSVFFKGFRAEFFKSQVTGLERMRYDRSVTWEDFVPYYRSYTAKDAIVAPRMYVLPQAWRDVVERLEANGVQMARLEKDSVMPLRTYRINSYETIDDPYEGHYLHSEVKTTEAVEDIQLFAGDYMIPVNQYAKRYLIATLEPRAVDSFFAWGFFDIVLQQKEWFSPYVFEDLALELLKNDPDLEKRFRKKQKEDVEFADDLWAQLIYIYRASPYYEKEHLRYPVYRSLD